MLFMLWVQPDNDRVCDIGQAVACCPVLALVSMVSPQTPFLVSITVITYENRGYKLTHYPSYKHIDIVMQV